MVWRRPPLSLHMCPLQSPLETRQLRRLLGGSRLPGDSRLLTHRSLPVSLLTPQPLQPPQALQPLTLHFHVKVMRAGAGGGGWGGSHGRERRGARSRLQTPSPPPASPSDVPSAPLLLAVEDVSDSSVTVSWEPPERLGRLGLQGYVLELRREGGELRVKPSYTEGRWAWGAVGTSPQTLQLSQNRGRRRGGVEAVCLSLMDSVLLTYTSLKAGGHPRGLSRCLVLQLQEASE